MSSAKSEPAMQHSLADAFAAGFKLVINSDNQKIWSVAFSPDGLTLVSGSSVGMITLWDVAGARVQRTFVGHLDVVAGVAFSPDGSTLTSESWDRTVKLWDVGSGIELQSFAGYGKRFGCVVFSPDGRTFAAASRHDPVKLWDVVKGREVRTLDVAEVSSIVFSPDGTILACGCFDATIKLWDVASGALLRTLTTSNSRAHRRLLRAAGSGRQIVRCVAFSPDGQTLASDSWDHTITLWDVAGVQEPRSLKGHEASLYSIAFAPDGATLAALSWDHTIKLWDTASGALRRTLSGGLRHRSSSIAFSPDSLTLASGSLDATVKLWDVTSGSLLRTLSEGEEHVRSVVFSPDSRTLVSEFDDKTARLWDVASGQERRSFDEDWARSNAFSADGGATTKPSDEEFLRNLEEAHLRRRLPTLSTAAAVDDERRRLEEIRGRHACLAMSPDRKTLAVSSEDGWSSDNRTITLWDLESGRQLRRFEGHEDKVTLLAFSPDGLFLASASDDKTIILWWVCDGAIAARYVAKGVLGSITLDGQGRPIAVSGNEDAIYYFMKDDEIVSVSEMRASGYSLPVPSTI